MIALSRVQRALISVRELLAEAERDGIVRIGASGRIVVYDSTELERRIRDKAAAAAETEALSYRAALN